MTGIWLVNCHFQSRITLHSSLMFLQRLCWLLPNFTTCHLCTIYFDCHLQLKRSIRKKIIYKFQWLLATMCVVFNFKMFNWIFLSKSTKNTKSCLIFKVNLWFPPYLFEEHIKQLTNHISLSSNHSHFNFYII